MRIGLLVTSVGSFGNKGFYNLQEVGLGKALGRKGHCVEIYKCVRQDRGGQTDEVAPNVRLHLIGVKTVSSNAIFSCEKVLDSKLDALVFMSDIQVSAVSACRWAKRHGVLFIPYVGTTRSTGSSAVKRLLMNSLADFIFRTYRNTPVLAKTNAVRNQLMQKGIKDVRTAPVGLDFDLLQKDYRVPADELKKSLGLDPGLKYILMVGRIENDRDPLDVVPVFSELYGKDCSFRLLIIGNGSLKSALSNSLAEKGLFGYTVFIPQVSNADMWKYYRSAEALVSFSRTEIFGMSILEAMYYELPVFVMHAPGPDDIIADGETGRLFYSLHEMAAAVAAGNSSDMGKAGHRQVAERFSWNSMADAIIEKSEETELPVDLKKNKGK